MPGLLEIWKSAADKYASVQSTRMDSQPLAHIAGPSGSGKSTVLEQFKQEFPRIVTKETDDWGRNVNKRLGLGWDTQWLPEQEETYLKARKAGLRRFQHNLTGPGVLGGFDDPGWGIEPDLKLLINTSPLRSTLRAVKRDSLNNRHGVELLKAFMHRWAVNRRETRNWKDRGYQSVSQEAALTALREFASAVRGEQGEKVAADAPPSFFRRGLLAQSRHIAYDPQQSLPSNVLANLRAAHSRGADLIRKQRGNREYLNAGDPAKQLAQLRALLASGEEDSVVRAPVDKFLYSNT